MSGPTGVLLVDPGLSEAELVCLAGDLAGSGRTVVAGFSTHPHWDHVLWHASLGEVPRYGTERAAAAVRDLLADPGWPADVAEALPPELAGQVPSTSSAGLPRSPPARRTCPGMATR